MATPRPRLGRPRQGRQAKRLALAGGLAVLVVGRFAAAEIDIQLPRENPAATISQAVGLTQIAVDYTSPAVKGRKIWGGAVPFNQLWSISPDGSPVVRFSKDVSVGDKNVSAGAYHLSAIPGKEPWTFVLAPFAAATAGTDIAGAPPTSDPPPDIRVSAQPKRAPYRERLTFLFSDLTDDKASLELDWEKLSVQLPISTKTSQQVQRGMTELDDAWRSFAAAARFMLENKKDFDAGLKYANQSLALKDDWYTRWVKAALLAGKRDFKQATAEAERAYELGPKGGDAFVVLEPQLKKNIADWAKLSTP